MWHTKMHFSAKCSSGRIAIQWFHIKHYLDYRYSKFQPYIFWVQKIVFLRYATLVPRLLLMMMMMMIAAAAAAADDDDHYHHPNDDS